MRSLAVYHVDLVRDIVSRGSLDGQVFRAR
jgi:hypothetical protein